LSVCLHSQKTEFFQDRRAQTILCPHHSAPGAHICGVVLSNLLDDFRQVPPLFWDIGSTLGAKKIRPQEGACHHPEAVSTVVRPSTQATAYTQIGP
jgi:hypothetical protein